LKKIKGYFPHYLDFTDNIFPMFKTDDLKYSDTLASGFVSPVDSMKTAVY